MDERSDVVAAIAAGDAERLAAEDGHAAVQTLLASHLRAAPTLD